MSGVKRGSPGAEDEKSPLEMVAPLSEEDAQKLQAVQKTLARVELKLQRAAEIKLAPVYESRRAVTKAISKFWPIALMNNSMFSLHCQHSADQLALSYLEDLWIERDALEPRCFTIEFHFKENPYFTDSVLKKAYKYTPPSTDDKPDEDGVTDAMLDFQWERDVTSSATKITWKDDSKNLTKLYPRASLDDDDDIPADSGSFFNFFETENDPFEIGMTIANEVYPEAIDYFLGNVGGEELDSEDEDSDDDEGAEEIDLEKPKPKKQKI